MFIKSAMNATSLYVSTSRLVFQSGFQSEDAADQNWTDLYRLVPYLRQSLSCTVCSRLLIEPYTPVDVHCQHHVCRLCVRGRKNLKPTCSWCKDYEKYEENMQLRILLQCYKSLCEHIMTTPIYNVIRKQSQAAGLLTNGVSIPSSSLVEFIEEGAKFQDNFKSNAGLSKSAYSILPCVFTNTTQPTTVNNTCLVTNNNNPQTNNSINSIVQTEQKSIPISQPPPIKTVSNGSAMYSVLYTGIGNKITIKRKTDGDEEFNARRFQTVIRPKPVSKRRGCRCGNATATPGKLTCCGQRCPCYVESKSCIDCKCRGCRNPHRPDGGKIRPHIPELACYEIQVADENSTSLTSATNNLTTTTTTTNNCLEIPLDDFNTSRLAGTTIKTTQPTMSFTTNHHNHHQIRQPVSIENVSRESLLISSPEGNFQVVNVFSSAHQTNNLQHHNSLLSTNHHHNHSHLHQQQLQTHQRTHSHQIPEISTTLPQILMQQQDPMPSTTLFATTAGLTGHNHHSTIALSSLAPTTITLSPIIVTSSSQFPSQIFNEEEIITTQCSLSPTTQQPPPLVEFVTNEPNSIDNLTV